MRLYKCILTGDEFFTDTYKFELKDGLYKVKGKYVTRSSDDVDESKFGSNPSAEEAAEGTEASSVSGVDVVLDNRLSETHFGKKKEYLAYFKDYVKSVESKKTEENPDLDVEAWRKQIQATFKNVVEKFDDYSFFLGASGNPDGGIALVRWEAPEGESDEQPYVYFFAEGIKEEKV